MIPTERKNGMEEKQEYDIHGRRKKQKTKQEEKNGGNFALKMKDKL